MMGEIGEREWPMVRLLLMLVDPCWYWSHNQAYTIRKLTKLDLIDATFTKTNYCNVVDDEGQRLSIH